MIASSSARTTTDLAKYRNFVQKSAREPHAYVVLLGLNVLYLPDIIQTIREGFAWKTVRRFMRNTGFTTEQVADLIGTTPRMLERRKAHGRLNANESDRLLRAARVYSAAFDWFDGDAQAATAWLTDRNVALGGASPLEYSRTEIGAGEVEDLVGRIEYGIFS